MCVVNVSECKHAANLANRKAFAASGELLRVSVLVCACVRLFVRVCVGAN